MAVILPIITTFDGKGLARARKEFSQLETVGQKASFILRKSMIPVAGAIAGVSAAAFQAGEALLGMAQGAAEDQQSQVALANSLKAATKATAGQVAEVEKFIEKTQLAYGISDQKLRPAFARLVRSTKDVEKAQRLLNLSLDLSAATGKPLETVSNALAKAYDGQTTALGRLGVGLDKAQLKAMSMDEITSTLERRYSGSAANAADTFAGKMSRLQESFGELQEQIGYVVMNALEPFIDSGLRVMEAYGEKGAAGAIQQLRFELGELAKTTEIGAFLKTLYDNIRRVYEGLRLLLDGLRASPIGVLSGRFGIPEYIPRLGAMPSWGDLTNVAPVVTPPMAGSPSPMDLTTSRVTGRSTAESQRPISITVTSADPRAVVDALIKYERQNGAIPVTTR